jgi:hypothetical protein
MRRRILVAGIVAALLLVAVAVRVGRRLGHPDLMGTADRAPDSHATGVARRADWTAASREARLARLDGGLRAMQDGDSLARRDRWDPAYVVGAVGREPDSLFAWVRDSTRWIPYLGRLRGPVGVLMDRQGNDLDRTLLLAALLQQAGQAVRLAHGQFTPERAAALLPVLLRPRRSHDSLIAVPRMPESATLRATAAKYRLDGEALARGLEAQDSAVTRFMAELDSRVVDQSRRLLAQVDGGDSLAEWQARYERALTALEDHWWVQRQDGERWIDLDLLAGLADPSAAAVIPATETVAPAALPASLEHELTVRVVGERWSAGELTEHVVLENTLRPADLYGRTIALQGWPGRWPAQLNPDPHSRFGLRGAALEQHAWGMVLLAGDSAVGQGALYDDGGEHRPPGNAGLGGLGGGIATIAPAPTPTAGPVAELTAAWVEFELHEPGQARRVVRRAVFDLIGPAVRAAGAPAQLALSDSARLTRSLALMIRTDILPVTARLAPEYVAHLAARSVVDNGPALRLIFAADSAHPPDPDTLIGRASPPLSPLYSLAIARLDWTPVRDRVDVDRLEVLTTHRHPAVMGNGFGLRGSTEIVVGDLGVPLTEPNAFEIRLRQGVFDTNAEAFWWPGAQVRNTGEAYQSAQGWVVLPSATRPNADRLQLPADARARIAQDLDSGFIVVTPTAPAGPEGYVGWWRVDPRTGVTRGVVGSGWGQCQEYAQLLRSALISAAENFAFDYAMCQALPLGINEIKGRIVDLEARGMLKWMGPVEYKSPTSVASENHKSCLGAAMVSGVFSTLPIILKVRRMMRAEAIAAEQEALAERRLLREAEQDAARQMEKNALAKNNALLKKPPPLASPPKFVREAEKAFQEAQANTGTAMTEYVRYKNSTPHPDPRILNDLFAKERQAMAAEADAWETLAEARREAGRPAPQLADVSGNIPDLEKEEATELLEIGFGDVLQGR